MTTFAEPRTIAGRLAAAHNATTCRVCNRDLDDAPVMTIGLSGSDARYYPDLATAQRVNRDRARYILDRTDDTMTVDDALAYLTSQRDQIDALVEHLEQRRLEQRAAREMRAAGITADPWPCDDCGHPKHRPADECDRCGDNPVPLGIAASDYNRARGYIA